MAEEEALLDADEFFAAEKRRRAEKFATACWDMYTAGKFDSKEFEVISNLCRDYLGSFWTRKVVPVEEPVKRSKRSKAKAAAAPPPVQPSAQGYAPTPQQPPRTGQHAPPTGGQ